MTRRVLRVVRHLATTPAWAVHFHGDDTGTGSTACFDKRCGRAPLTTDYSLRV